MEKDKNNKELTDKGLYIKSRIEFLKETSSVSNYVYIVDENGRNLPSNVQDIIMQQAHRIDVLTEILCELLGMKF